MRVLHVIDSLAAGGAETSLAEMVPEFVAQGIDTHVLSLGSRLDLRDRIEAGGGVVHTGPARAARGANIRAAVRTIRATSPDLVHTSLFEADIAGRIAATWCRVPVVSSIVSDSYGESHRAEAPRAKLLAAQAADIATARLVRRFHAISESIADSVAPRLRIDRDKITVIPRGRDPERFPFQPPGVRDTVRTELGIEHNRPLLLAVARHEPPKGLVTLIEACAQPDLDRLRPILLIAGREGRSTPDVQRAIVAARSDVHLLGGRSDVADLLAAADVFCFPSVREGLGGALIEAMAVGCPIVASDIPTTREVLGRPPCGHLFAVNDPTDLAQAIVRSVTTRKATGTTRDSVESARTRFLANFTTKRVTSQLVEWYSESIQCLVDRSTD